MAPQSVYTLHGKNNCDDMALFVDALDIQLMLLSVLLIISAYMVALVSFKSKDPNTKNMLKGTGLFFIVVGAYAFITGIVGTILWQLPSSYNIVLSDPWAFAGIISLMLGFALFYNVDLKSIITPMLFLGIIPIVYAVVILAFGMTSAPIMAFGMYGLIGASMMLSPLAIYPKEKTKRIFAILIVILLILAALISMVIGVGAAFQHIGNFKAWVPPYS